MRHVECLICGIAEDRGAEEVVLVFTIQQRGEIDRAVFANDREGETCPGWPAGIRSTQRENALSEAAFANEPVHARARKRRVDAGAIEFDGIGRRGYAGGAPREEQRLLDSLGI